MSYGMPYMGSKSKIAKDIIRILPSAEYFIDLFGGGGSMSHCALLSNKYDKIIYNEKETLVYNRFKMAITGNFKDEQRWIDRDTFDYFKTTDPYVALCFSFGNNLRGYCYSEFLEPWKKALHYARVMNDFSELNNIGIHGNGSREDVLKNFDNYKNIYSEYINHSINCDAMHFAELENLERLHRLQSIFNDCNSFHSVKYVTLECYNDSYEHIEIPENSIIYCDIPYKDTRSYLSEFNHEEFYDWVRRQKAIVFISEYNMPQDFYLVHKFTRRELYNSNDGIVTECLYCNKSYHCSGLRKLF